MNDDDKPNKPQWAKNVIRRITESSLAFSRPGSLCFASITASTAGPATAIIRNGNDENAEKIFDLAAPASSMAHGHFQPPLYFSKGVYVDVGENVTSVLVHIRQ